MRLEVLPRLLFADLRGDAEALLEIAPDAQRVAREAAETRFVETGDLHHSSSRVADARLHRRQLLLDCGRRRLGRRKSRDLLQDQLPLDRLLHGRRHVGDLASTSPNSTSASTSVCVMASVPIRASDAVEELLSIESAAIQQAKGDMHTEHYPTFSVLCCAFCILNFA